MPRRFEDLEHDSAEDGQTAKPAPRKPKPKPTAEERARHRADKWLNPLNEALWTTLN